jgi:hypothetical protein
MNNKTYFDWTVTGLSLGLATGAICLIGLSAHAQPGPNGGKRGGGQFLNGADTNGDGNITLEELQAVKPEVDAERFARMDRNDDGVLNEADRPEGRRGRRGPGPDGERGPNADGRRGPGPDGDRGPGRRGHGQFMEKADTDGDGGVSLEELQAIRPDATAELFAKRDTNGDGVLNRDDRPEMGREGRGPEGREGKRGPGAEGRRGGGERMKALDTNEDGGVSFEEMQAVRPDLTQEDFDARDKNGDGVINREDGPPARGERRKK